MYPENNLFTALAVAYHYYFHVTTGVCTLLYEDSLHSEIFNLFCPDACSSGSLWFDDNEHRIIALLLAGEIFEDSKQIV